MMNTKRIGQGLVLIAGLLLAIGGVAARAVDLEKQFRELPMEARRLTGPLFWLHGDESKERLEMYVEKVAQGGNGSFTAESRPHNDWLGEGWWRDLSICLEAARKNNLEMWIFDEKWWPSGEVGGMVPQEYGCKTMVAEAAEVEGPRAYEQKVAGENFIALLAGKVSGEGVDGASLVDLREKVADGVLKWQAPAGKWRVMSFGWKFSQARGGNVLLDGASKDAVDWYIKTVYQPHYDRFKADFGGIIRGYFYDEPETHGDWGSEVLPILAERKVDWKRALAAWKFKLAGEEQAIYRYQYQDAKAEAWGRTWYGAMSRWCQEHKVKSIGHFLEHRLDYFSPSVCAGNMFQLQKYSDMGAIDAVFAQFVMGRREANDNPTWQTPKLGSSISHAYGKEDDVAMVEIFGARGQDLTYPEMKWWTDHMQVSGINFMIPHSFNPRSPYDADCPPYFYNGGYEPRWPLYRVYADYTSRLTLMLTGGRHVCPVAFLFAGNSYHVGKTIAPEDMTSALQDGLFDCDWIPYEVFENDMTMAKGELQLRQERYRVLIMPAAEVIPYETLAKARAWYDGGGVVVGYGILPSQSATPGKGAADIAALRQAIWGDAPAAGLKACQTNAAGGRSYLLAEKPTVQDLQQALTVDGNIHPTLEVLNGKTGNWLHVLHRQKDGRDIFLICNQNTDAASRTFTFRARAAGTPECWDAMRNEITAIPFVRVGAQTVDFNLTLAPLESMLVVFNPQATKRPPRLEPLARPKATVVVAREGAAEPKQSIPPQTKEGRPLELTACSWVWHKEGNPQAAAPAGERYFRRKIEIPAGSTMAGASFRLTADNSFVLYVNGQKAGSGDNWKDSVLLDIADKLKAGTNCLAIAAVNGSDQPNPAGLIGRWQVKLADGKMIEGMIDGQWKSSAQAANGWQAAGFDDSKWPAALAFAVCGAGPWGAVDGGGQITLSPAKLDIFQGKFVLPKDWMGGRIYLEAQSMTQEEAASITVNGKQAGGFIGKPCRLEISALLRDGENRVEITPFAPAEVRIAYYPTE